VFCSGADFAAVSGPGALDFLPAFESMLSAVAGFKLPVIACIHGAALGGGLQLATACDFRVIAEEAKLGIPSSRLGIVINFENVQRLVLLVGIARAKEILMAGRMPTAAEAVAWGLATTSVPEARLADATNELARQIAELAPLSVQGAKRTIGLVAEELLGRAPEDVESVAAGLVAEAYSSADLQEGLNALADKRAPRFKGS
jgi:enoyl-CoA hydratase